MISTILDRRIRAVGELLANQVRLGLFLVERNVSVNVCLFRTMNLTPQQIINIRPV